MVNKRLVKWIFLHSTMPDKSIKRYANKMTDIWCRTSQITKEKTRCRHIWYSFRLPARVLLYAPFHWQNSTYHGLCYTNRGTLTGTRKLKNNGMSLYSSMGPPSEIDPTTHRTTSGCSTTDLHIAPQSTRKWYLKIINLSFFISKSRVYTFNFI